jgi:hypothetical protein
MVLFTRCRERADTHDTVEAAIARVARQRLFTRLRAAAFPGRVEAVPGSRFNGADPSSSPNAPATFRDAGCVPKPCRLLSIFSDVDATPDLFEV